LEELLEGLGTGVDGAVYDGTGVDGREGADVEGDVGVDLCTCAKCHEGAGGARAD